MMKIDFKKEWKHLYNPPKTKFTILDVPKMQFLMVDGHGDPNTAQEYQEAIEALYGVAYKLKFVSKKVLEKDYVVPPLEGLWWAEDMAVFSSARDKSQWDWTMMVMTPEWISGDVFALALEQVRKAKNPAALDKIRLDHYHEGLSVQIMHMGSFDEEGPVLAEMHNKIIPDNGYIENGKHHEIYLSDFRKVSPDKLKTILRQPVREK